MEKPKKEKEIWAEVVNSAGLYEISNKGNLRSYIKGFREGTPISGHKSSRGNIEVCIKLGEKKRTCSVARLVAEVFIPNENPAENIYVIHLDGDKQNNNADNLKWAEKREWLAHSHQERQNTRFQTLALMKEKAVQKAKEMEEPSAELRQKQELISSLNPEVETWGFLPDTDNRYSVSSFGRLKSHCYSEEGTFRKLGTSKKTGFLKAELSYGKKKSKCLIHRLIAEVFVQNDDPINKTMVVHIDGNKTNNHAENLKWISYDEWVDLNRKRLKEPAKDGSSKPRGNTHLTIESVRLIRKLASEGVSSTKLAKLFRVSAMQILRIKKNQSWKEEDYQTSEL